MTRKPVKKAQRLLLEVGIVRHARRRRALPTDATAWDVLPEDHTSEPVLADREGAEGTVQSRSFASRPGQDLWFQAGLGKPKWRLWVVLGDLGETTVPELATALERQSTTVRRHLSKLAAVGLVTHVGNHRWQAVVDPAHLDAVAEKLGVAGRLDGLRVRHGDVPAPVELEN